MTESGVFDGLHVLDFSRALAGPIATKYLADYGATVLRIESTRSIDILRVSAPYKDGRPGINRAGHFGYWNSNKRSMGLNLGDPRGLVVAKQLVAWADIVVENFSPGVMEKLGLGYEVLSDIKPDLIVLRSSNQGQTGPDAHVAGYGSHLASLAGFATLVGWPDRMPAQPFGGYSDIFSAPLGAAALIAALDHRRHTGQGQLLDVSQWEVGLHFLAPVLLDYQINGRETHRCGNLSSSSSPHNVYRCKGTDRWCAISVSGDEQWRLFCAALGDPPWIHQAEFATVLDRKRNEAELDRLVEKWTLGRTAEEVMTLLQAAGIAAGAVASADDLLTDSQLAARHCFWMLEHPELGSFAHFASPFTLSETPAEAKLPSPCLGEATEFFCTEILAMPQQEFVSLLDQGVLEVS